VPGTGRRRRGSSPAFSNRDNTKFNATLRSQALILDRWLQLWIDDLAQRFAAALLITVVRSGPLHPIARLRAAACHPTWKKTSSPEPDDDGRLCVVS
jgi:hypothetical protein